MIFHRHVYILFQDGEDPSILIKRINTENKYKIGGLTEASKYRLARELRNYPPYIDIAGQLVFWDAVVERGEECQK